MGWGPCLEGAVGGPVSDGTFIETSPGKGDRFFDFSR